MENNNEIINEQVEKEYLQDNYMDWLEKITSIENTFDTKSMMYLPSMTKEDRTNLNRMGVLYDRIDDYARSNNIDANWSNGYSSYNVKYNNTGYSIVRSYSENVHFVFKKRQGEPIDYFIDFDNIITREQECAKVLSKKYVR